MVWGCFVASGPGGHAVIDGITNSVPDVTDIKIALEGWRHWLEGVVPSSDRSQKPGLAPVS